jgi:hypothetical protein
MRDRMQQLGETLTLRWSGSKLLLQAHVRECKMFHTYRPGKHVVRVANGRPVAALGKGDVIISVRDSM